MITDDTKTVVALNGLMRVLRDSEKGFETAADLVSDAALVELFAGWAVERAKFREELRQRVKTLRAEPADDEAPGGALHRGWMELRAVAGDHPTYAVLAECARGEEITVTAYAAALRNEDLDKQSRDLVQRHYEAVQAAHDRVRQLRDRAEKVGL